MNPDYPPKITVIIPTYKPKDYIWECLESLYGQTFNENFEVIIVLNGCIQPFCEQIETFLRNHDNANFRLVHTETAGVSNARNLAIDIAKGEYICFIDDDDWVSPNYLEGLYKHAAPDVIPLCRPLSFLDGTTNYEPYYITKDYERHHGKKKVPFLIPHRFFNGPVYKLIHRDVIGNCRFDVRFRNGEDSLFMFLCSDKFKWVEFADESCIYYRRYRKDSASLRKRSFVQRIENAFSLSLERSKIFFGNLGQYNLKFYLRQVCGSYASAILNI